MIVTVSSDNCPTCRLPFREHTIPNACPICGRFARDHAPIACANGEGWYDAVTWYEQNRRDTAPSPSR